MDNTKSRKFKTIAAYGSWVSPITSASILSGSVTLDELQLYNNDTYWLEKRPHEAGRCVIVRYREPACKDLLPAPYSCRTRVHEYGGGSYCVTSSGCYFVNDEDQHVYFFSDTTEPVVIINEPGLRFADLVYDELHNQLICVCENHANASAEPENTLIAIDILNKKITTLCRGYDFYSNPRLNQDNSQLVWLCWNHPCMPWDGTELWLATVNNNGDLANHTHIAGSANISIFQPEWSPTNTLYFVSDETGWWNIYQYNNKNTYQIIDQHYEFGLPQWVFAQSSYAFVTHNTIICCYIKNGEGKLALVNTENRTISTLNTPWSTFQSIKSNHTASWFISSSSDSPPQIIKFDPDNLEQHSIKSSCSFTIDKSYCSAGQIIKFSTRHNDNAYAIYYAPANKNYDANNKEAPPLIVITHGGPTAASTTALDLRKQYWTSRGFALLDVNYSGSTGFGRAYRKRLDKNWGIRDAEDCCDAALHLVKQGLADAQRLIIKGSSAGGYTVLCALTFHDVFSAGASYYGIGELEALVTDTHKFESRYLDQLIGPYPQSINIYKQRSPIFHTEKLDCPVIFFQGTEDKVVPKEQAEKMYAALRKKGTAVSYLPFPGEQHGFRKAETIKKCLDSELAFYAAVFNIPVHETIPLKIDNLRKL